MSNPMLGLEDIVGKRFESCEIDVVEELREGKGVLFAIFPIGATMQDGGKRKRSVGHISWSWSHNHTLHKRI